MRAGLLSVAGIPLLQLAAARAPHHQNHQHLHEKRAPAVVQEVVTNIQDVYYDSKKVIVYEDADHKPVSTVTYWDGPGLTSAILDTTSSSSSSSSSSTPSTTPPPPPPTTTPPPPQQSSSSSAAPPPAQEKIAERPHPQEPASSPPPAFHPPPPQSSAAPPAPSSSAPATGGGGGGGGAGAKGVAYNTPAQASQVPGIAWACNWGQQSGLPNTPPFEYVPQLWGKKDGMTESFASNVAGAKHLLFYNEPDMDQSVGGSGIDVGTAVQDFKDIMQPLQKQGKLVSTPCVANSDSDYLEKFLSAFPNGSVDILCFHWYGPDVNGLSSTVDTFQALASKYGVKQMWMNEWAVQPAPEDLSKFTSYLDGKVDRYAYNMNDMAGSTGY